MKSKIRQFVERVFREAKAGREPLRFGGTNGRTFCRYDWGSDTFIFEKDAWLRENEHLPILVVRKDALSRGREGYVMTLTTGNHSVAAIPLLKGQFWNMGSVAPARRSQVMKESVVCSNAVSGRIEISQRDVPTEVIREVDEWLQRQDFGLDEVIMAERNDATLEYYRSQGQEWRVKPLAWTRREMEFALQASRTSITSALRYYHSAKGVHFLTYTEFHKLTEWVAQDYAKFVACLKEMVSIFEGDVRSCMRTDKFGEHHEIELFGVRRGTALDRLVPALENLMEHITLKRLPQNEVSMRLRLIDSLFSVSLERPQLADETSKDFIETLYLHLTGSVYSGQSNQMAPAFDDRRTALPGATFLGGRPAFHPGADYRTRVMLANVGPLLSQDEVIEYANVYEIRLTGEAPLGSGVMREIVYKTNRSPLCTSLIEKRLKLTTPGYGSYMLARVKAFKALGVSFGEYRLLIRPDNDNEKGREANYFMRNRCPGEPLEGISPSQYYRKGDFGVDGMQEDKDVVLRMGALLGDAAAQNLVLKKYLKETDGTISCRFGKGKEIFEFGCDSMMGREMPMRVMLCSMRGALGWPDLSETDENLDRLFNFYFGQYAEVLYRFWESHRQVVSLDEMAEQFFTGFQVKTREMKSNYVARREQFDGFEPAVRKRFAFKRHWRFALWSLERQENRLAALRTLFMEKVRALEGGVPASPAAAAE